MKLNSLMVRYIVNDVDAAVAFYTQRLGFSTKAQSGPNCSSQRISERAQPGGMLALRWKKFDGSYLRLSATSRS